MAYDVEADAKYINELSEGICSLARRFSVQDLARRYQSTSSELEDLAVKVAIDGYVADKRRFTMNLLNFPHNAATLTVNDPTAARVLSRVGRNQPLPADEVVQPLVAPDKKRFQDFGLLWSYIPDAEAHDLSWDSFHGWHGTAGYLEGIIAARPMITTVGLPKAIAKIIGEIRMCYGFGQMIATEALCRTLLEVALTDVCVRLGVLTPHDVASDYFFSDFPPRERIARTLQGEARREASVVYGALSRVIHGSAAPGDTRAVIRQTFGLVERLYAQNESKLHGTSPFDEEQ